MSDAVNEREIEIQTSDGTVDGYIYHPAAQKSSHAVILLPDIASVRPAYRESGKRLAALGYVVLLPNVFYRTGKPPALEYPIKIGDEKTMKRMAELKASLSPDAMERDGLAYVDFVSRQEGVASGVMGVVGYCFTGAMAMRMAAASPAKIAAAASFHGGGLYTEDPASPHLVLPRIKARLYFGHAVQDRSMPQEAIEKFERALAAWGGQYESETYEGALHSWTTLDSPVYNKPQAERAFSKLAELFRAALQ